MKNFGNLLWGLVFLVLGLIFGLNALGITDINVFFKGWWTLFIIIPCFIGLFKDKNKTGNIIGLIIGVILLVCVQGIIPFSLIWKLALPLVFVIIGIVLIFNGVITGRVRNKIKEMNKGENTEYCATFATQRTKVDGEEFKGANINAIFGSVELDLRNAIITNEKVIEASAIFGGVDIYVPSNVKVKVTSVPIFGGVSDKSNKPADENAPTIYISAFCMFGGVDIK